ncbi:hypothetical protein L6452_12655, partial [Arctium lappa]
WGTMYSVVYNKAVEPNYLFIPRCCNSFPITIGIHCFCHFHFFQSAYLFGHQVETGWEPLPIVTSDIVSKGSRNVAF